MAWTFCTSGAAIAKAGAQANSTITASGATLLNWSNEAENSACTISGVNLLSQYSSLTANGKEILQQYCSAKIARQILVYDQSGYFLGETNNILNVLQDQIKESESILRDKTKVVDYLGGTI